jgi:hypothetical protein
MFQSFLQYGYKADAACLGGDDFVVFVIGQGLHPYKRIVVLFTLAARPSIINAKSREFHRLI